MWGSGRSRRPSGDAGGVGGVTTATAPPAARRRFWRPATVDRRTSAEGDLLDPSVDLVGATVTQLRFDSCVTITLDATTHLRIATGFELAAPGAEPTALDPEHDVDRMGPLLRLHRQRVAEFAADTSGSLAIVFTEGASLRCRPDDRFEAWELGFADGRLYVCLPGGEVAVWAGAGD